jgi:predicted nucleotidyltransferase
VAKYDDASWHYGGDYPEDLPNENAAFHIGMFITWIIENDLMSDEQIDDNEDDILKVKRHEMTGGKYLIKNCDEKFSDYDLCKIGNNFAKDYYRDDTKFGKKYSGYTDDFCDVFNITADENGYVSKSLYYVEETWKNYELIKKVIDKRFLEWKEYKEKSKK